MYNENSALLQLRLTVLIRRRSRYKLIEIDLYGGKPQWFLELNPKGYGSDCHLTNGSLARLKFEVITLLLTKARIRSGWFQCCVTTDV